MIGLGDWGETPDAFGSIEWILFALASVITLVIMMNLLISIIGDTFDRVQMETVIADAEAKLDMILEAESMMFWNRDEDKKEFLQSCSEF